MNPHLPLHFAPVFRSYLWGGDRLARILNKPVPDSGVWAESWEIVDHGADQSVVIDGQWKGRTLGSLVQEFRTSILGDSSSGPFPLLLKYLDCQRVLSVQVHPDDEYAKQMEVPDLGKTEAWYVVEAEPGAKLYAGLVEGVDRSRLETALANGNVESLLRVLYPKAGDCVFIPAGTVHALGEGLLVAEIQQASDTTFRLFDWNRLGPDGKPRALHVREALDVIDFQAPSIEFCHPLRDSRTGLETLVACDCFTLERAIGPSRISLPDDHSFRMVTVTSGRAELEAGKHAFPLERGESRLIPAVRPVTQLQVSAGSVALIASRAASD